MSVADRQSVCDRKIEPNFLLQTDSSRYPLLTDWTPAAFYRQDKLGQLCIFFQTVWACCVLQTDGPTGCKRHIGPAVGYRKSEPDLCHRKIVPTICYRQTGPDFCYRQIRLAVYYRQIGPAVIDKIGPVGFYRQIGPRVCLRQDWANWMLRTQKGGGAR